MPRILFWNIQRAKGTVTNIITNDLTEDLESLAAATSPHIIVLCEVLNGMLENSGLANIAPSGYEILPQNSQFGQYSTDTTLQYFIMRRIGSDSHCYLVDAQTDTGGTFGRPALLITVGVQSFIALHAQSISAHTRTQTNQMFRTYDVVTDLIGNGSLQILNRPCMILGDLNIDLRNPLRVNSATYELQQTNLNTFQILDPGVGTHFDMPTGTWNTTLDWGLYQPGIVPTIAVLDVSTVSRMKRKRVHDDYGPPKKKKKKKRERYSGEDSDDDSYDNQTFLPEFQDKKSPDHRPILIEW